MVFELLNQLCRAADERFDIPKTSRRIRDVQTEIQNAFDKSLTLLLKSNLSCKEIAVLCHYGSYSSFFRRFTKKYKVSPDIFRSSSARKP